MVHPRTLPALLIAALLPSIAHAEERNPVIEFAAIGPVGASYGLETTEPVVLFDSRQAKRRLDTLAPGQPLTVLAFDRFGLKVKGTGKNGLITGWISQRRAFANDSDMLDRTAGFYDRQIEIEKLVAAKTPAIGMTMHELTRILGPATNHNLETADGKRTETVTWARTEKVDLNDTLDLGTDAAILKVDVETGRVTVQLVGGVATAIALNVQGAPGNAIPQVAPPVLSPFARGAPAALAAGDPGKE